MSTTETTDTTEASAIETEAGPRLPVVHHPGRVPIKSWATDLEGSALQQAVNLSNLPFAIDHVALMPDAHTGYGMPIGGVLFADHAVVPYAIGVDIGCGVALAETDLTVETVSDGELEAVLTQIARDVPVGMKRHTKPVDPQIALDEIGLEPPRSIDYAWFERVVNQLGTLGSGNHFLELQRDAAGQLHVMLHSGSRNLGKVICDTFHQKALVLNRSWHSQLPHDELAFLPEGTHEFEGYWEAMRFALRFAEVNRSRMLDAVEAAFARHTRIGRFERRVDIHHNYAAWEHHGDFGGIVHRKGAVRARPGEPVLIPGSMGSASYVAEGLGNADAFETCAHGAGRAMSRTAARKTKTSSEVVAEMQDLGVSLHAGDPRTVAEEAAFAYKDIESVMAASSTLVRPVKRLTPLGVVKG